MLLAKHKNVHVILAEGNHDMASSVWLRTMFKALYENEPRITVDDSALPYYAHEFGNVMNVLPGVMGGPNEAQQQYQQAKTNFITAVLRKESGAAIGQNEFETEEKKYFPQASDSKANIAQKQRARELAIEAMKIQAGPGAKSIGSNTGGWEVVR
jgi:hypothetical protein